jgi:predicted ATPase/DNA-binding CsgD family transcriptional regulator
MRQAGVLPRADSTLPAQLTGFVGRRQEQAEVRRLVSSSRLVTLTGFGGLGKTRLALQVAGELSRVYRDGVWFVPFADLSDPALVADAAAAALGIQDHSSRLDGHRLSEHLRHRELLLVFDNCEHLIDACAALAELLLRGCPRLHILATSREPLRVDGESVRPVLPLPTPSPMNGTLEEAEGCESVQLLVERARQVAPGFAVNEENRADIIEVCRQLDGIPLALELVAVRLRAMSPSELLQELRRHWQLLDVGIRAAPDRHQTMTACLEWSNALCEPEERELWARLSVFVGGMEMDAIQYLAAQGPDALPPDRVVQVVYALVDKSILISEPGHDRMRYRMLEIVRLFGAAHLDESGYTLAMRKRHRDWYAEMLARFDERWMSPQQIEVMRRVRREEANIRAALRFCWRETGEAAAGLDMAARLRKYSTAYGWFREDRLWLHRLLPKVPDPTAVRLGGLHAACWLAVLQGDREAAAGLLAECSELAARLDNPATSRAEQLAGWHELFLGDLSASVQHLQRAVDGFRAVGWSEEQAESLVLLGMAHGFAGELTQAAEAYAECLRICGGASPWARSYALQWGGLVAYQQGDHEKALAWEKESLELKRDMQERLGVALCLEALAWIEGDRAPRRASTMLGAGAALLRNMGSSPEALPGLFTYHEGSQAKLRGALTERQFVEAFERGASMPIDAAIAFALDESSPAPPAPGSTGDDVFASSKLTPREREVARLIADGLSNKDIASSLVISSRTAEGHVEHILVKLGFASRGQIAAWVSKHSDVTESGKSAR